MDTKFTPGPWNGCTARDGKCTCGHVWSIPGDFPVCTVLFPNRPIAVAHEHMADAPDMIYQSISPEMCRANARLIAAAPDMYDALKHFVKEYDAGSPVRTADFHLMSCRCMRCIRDLANSLLAKVQP